MFRRRRRDQEEEAKANSNATVLGDKQTRGRLLGRLNRALKLNSEKHDVSAGGMWSQLRALNRLMQQDTTDEASSAHVDMQILQLVQQNPGLAQCRFKVDMYEEFLLHQIVCKRPSIELVVYVYQLNPDAVKVPGYGGYSLLHHACWCHASLEVIQFLVAVNEPSIRGPPFPPLFCAVDKETSFGVLEFLIKSYPEALCASDISSVTPLDIALVEELSLAVVALFVQWYPNTELKVTEKGGSAVIQPEVACILASQHDVIRTIDATFLKFTAASLTAFFEVLATNNTLNEIVLNLTDIEIDKKVGEALIRFLTKENSLKKFSVCGGTLDEALGYAMVSGIHANQTITNLVIEGGLVAGGVESLLNGSPTINRNLEKLSLKYTVARGADWSGLSSFVLLQILDLSNCQVGPSLATPLADLLERTRQLQEMFVGRNNIGDEGTVEIAKALQVNNTLHKLEYEQNNIGELGWMALTETLREFNVCLRFIRFATEDQFYDKHYPQIVYYCDQNGFGRQISPKKPANVCGLSADDQVESAFHPAGESTGEAVDSNSLLPSPIYKGEAESSAEIDTNNLYPLMAYSTENIGETLEEETIEWG